MSTNVSLGDTPGVSAYFDGQPIQDQQEAELRKEEERQEKELRCLLEAELEDFEDDEDFLSGSNSEEDAANESLSSGHVSTRSSTDFLSMRDNDRRQQRTVITPSHRDPLALALSKPGSTSETPTRLISNSFNPAEDSPAGSENSNQQQNVPMAPQHSSVGHLDQPQGIYTQPSRRYTDYRQDESDTANGYIANSLGPGDQSKDIHNHGGYSDGRTRDDEAYMPNVSALVGDHDAGPKQDVARFLQRAEDGGPVSRYNFNNNPASFQRAVSSGDQKEQHMNEAAMYGLDGRVPQSNSFDGRVAEANFMDFSTTGSNRGVLIPSSHPHSNSLDNNASNNNIISRDSNGVNDNNEWMMKVQTSGVPSQYQHQHHHHHSHPHQLQQQQHFQHSPSHHPLSHPHTATGHKHHHSVPISDASRFYKKSPPSSQPLPKYSHQHHHYLHHQQQQQLHNQLQQQQHHHQQQHNNPPDRVDSPPPPPLPSTLPPSLPLATPTSSVPPQAAETQYKVIHNQQPVKNSPAAADSDDSQYKVTYNKNQNALPNSEEEFFLSDDHIEFFKKDGPDEKVRLDQLEVLYRARGREVEELKRRLEEREEEVGREKRALKHRAAVAEGEATGTGESLKQCQRLLQQAKEDHSQAVGRIAALEKELSAFKETKEELVKKLTQAESTIETLSQHVTELSESDSVSRARREHEAVVSSLTQRHQREMLLVKEQLDITRAELTVKTEELGQVREQLGEATLALEQAQVSRGETVNRLSRSLEESQRRCQELLEQLGSGGAARELTALRVRLEQSQESTRISEELCHTYQGEIKDLKEQLSMLETATTLGAFSMHGANSVTSTTTTTATAGRVPQSAPSADDSMTDLGIRRTLDFSSTPKSEERREISTQRSLDDDLASSLRRELERCLCSNREKRSEVAELRGQVKSLTERLEEAKGQIVELEKMSGEQKKRLAHLDELVGDGESGGAVEARLQRDLDKMGREKAALLEDIQDYQQRLEEVGASEARLTEINAELSQQVSAMVATGDQDKADALARCQRTMEETGRITVENLRKEMGERHAAEAEVLAKRAERQIGEIKQQLDSALSELNEVKALYVNVCRESTSQEAELTDKFKRQLEAETQKIEDRVELEKREWREFIREEVLKKEEEERKVTEEEKINKLEAELRAEWEKEAELKASKARLEALQDQRKALDEERQAWENKMAETEASLAEKAEKISRLSSELEEARQQCRRLEEKIKTQESGGENETPSRNGSPATEKGLAEKCSVSKAESLETEEINEKAAGISEGHYPSTLVSSSLAGEEIGGAEEKGQAKDGVDSFSNDTNVSNSLKFGSAAKEDGRSMEDGTETSLKPSMETEGLGQNDESFESSQQLKTQLEDIVKKLEEREREVERLKEELEKSRREMEEKGRELEEQRQKGREAEDNLQQREQEVVELRERLRQQVEETAEEVDQYKRKVEELESAVEKTKAELAQHCELDRTAPRVESLEIRDAVTGAVDSEGVGGGVINLPEDSTTVLPDRLAELSLQQLRQLVENLQEKTRVEGEAHRVEMEKQQDQHRTEVEKAARQREGKYQTELRYFLKEREEKGRSRMEDALRDCQAKHEEELAGVLRDREETLRQEFEVSLREVRRLHEEEKKGLEVAFQQRLAEEVRERLKDKGLNSETPGEESAAKQFEESTGGEKALESLQAEVRSLTEELRIEKLAREEKLRLLVEEKDGQMVNMALRHEKEEEALKEGFQRERSELREAYEVQVKNLQAELTAQSEKLDSITRQMEESTRAKVTVERLKLEAGVEKRLEERLREETENKLRGEMEVRLRERVREELKREGEKRNEEAIEKGVKERLQEERGKWFKDAEEYISSEVRRGVEDRVREEEDKRKNGFEKEVEDKVKWRLEEEQAKMTKQSEETVKEKMEAEMKDLKRKFSAELGARIEREKSRLEQEVAEWKAKAKREMERDREERVKDMASRAEDERQKWMRKKSAQLERRVAEERRKLEGELRKARDEEILELRKELEEEMRSRIHREKKEWEADVNEERQRRQEKGEGEEEDATTAGQGHGAELVSAEEKLKSEVEARTKACAERDKAVAFIRHREMSYKEERQRLVAGLERCRGDLEAMKGEHQELEGKCTAMDARYKEDMRNARRRREEDLEALRRTMEREKEEALAAWEGKLRALREECGAAMEKAKSQGELEKASLLAAVHRRAEGALEKSSSLAQVAVSDTDSSTILELRDHYLDTVAKIKADVMSHVKEANTRAATTMRAQIRKQREKVVEDFKVKVKACLRAALTGQLSETCIVSLENSIDALSQQLLSSTSASSSSSSGNTPRSEHNNNNDDNNKLASDRHSDEARTSPGRVPASVYQDEYLGKQVRGRSPSRISPPSKDAGAGSLFDAFDKMWPDAGELGKLAGLARSDSLTPSVGQQIHARAQRDLPFRMSPLLQLDKVDWFDSAKLPLEKISTLTPVGSKSSSPAHTPTFDPTLPLQRQLSSKSAPSSSPRPATPTAPRGENTAPGGGSETDPRPDQERSSPFVTTTRGSGHRGHSRGRDKNWTSDQRVPRDAVTKPSSLEYETSPRDQMKMVEARVRLAHWAKSGAAPWRSYPSLGGGGGGGSDDCKNWEDGGGGPVMEERRQSPADREAYEDGARSWRRGGKDTFEGENSEDPGGGFHLTEDGFRVPGLEAEKWVRSQKRIGVKPRETMLSREWDRNFQQNSEFEDWDKRLGAEFEIETRDGTFNPGSDFYPGKAGGKSGEGKESFNQRKRANILKSVMMAQDQFLSSDESVTSDGSHTSLVTLEPEEKTLVGVSLYKDGVGQRGRSVAGSSLTTQNPVDSGLPSSTRTVNSSVTAGPDRRISPGRRGRIGREEEEVAGDNRFRDYERIRAAVLQRGGGGGEVRDGMDYGHGPDSLTSSDDDRSPEEFKAFPSKSADRTRGGRFVVPTSTPLVKQADMQPRAWSEGRAQPRRGGKGQKVKGVDTEQSVTSEQESWRHLGGHTFFESERLAAAAERREERSSRDRGGYRRDPAPQKSGSLPQHSRQRQAASGRRHAEGGDDLVLRSAEFASLTPTRFPSDLSRITQGSGQQEETTEGGMWRYRSLEDLIGVRSDAAAGAGDTRRLKVYNATEEGDDDDDDDDDLHDQIRHKKGKKAKVESRRSREHESSLHEPQDTWYGRGGRAGGPVQAMNSEFWERYRSREDEEEDDDEDEDEGKGWPKQRKEKTSFERTKGGGAKIQRSTSEQSLHTLRSRDSLAGGGDERGNAADDVDSLLAQYLSPARSSFDLRPFARDEHF